ncbi:RecQ family ATP-dependent DNA helicase [Polaribacter sp.]|uniref:RecQ family ATP-dependent DNA helicase n=1 Tax=Polaribacter sp. TaxID=1920175 RepID=UPI003F6C2507
MSFHLEKILEKNWGHRTFRAPQKEIITAVLDQKDVIVLLPTGGGKSICFQIPALVKDGVCIVISPLIALMQNQVENLKKRHIKAVTIPSGSNQNDIIAIFDAIKFGNVKFLYISPERLQSRLIQQKIKELNVNLVAIDEAHCISEWGHDFRPSYRNIAILKEQLENVNFIALTATANKKVLEDIANNLQLNNPVTFKKSFYRENLAYQIFKIEDKLERLKQIFYKTKTPAIVYVNSRKKTVELSNFLNANQYKSSYYHAGLTALEKQTAFNNWLLEKTPIIVATNAFGMGIDKANVGLVIHFTLPSNIENYIQETGRAGRNGKKAFGVLLYNENDILLHKEQTTNSIPSISEIKEIHQKLYQNFRIAKGELTETVYEFNFQEFCKKYKFHHLKTATTLNLLSNYGIIELENNFQNKSTLTFVGSHKSILNFTHQNKKLKEFVHIVLRTYGGLFENEIKINEFLLAKKAGITSLQVIKNLKDLDTLGLVAYHAVTSDTLLSFLVPREDDRAINRYAKQMQHFLAQKKEKANDFVDFITNHKTCRSIQILAYFNEKSTINCGICDVCISNKKMNLKDISTQIINLLAKEATLSSKEISNHLQIAEKDILIHLQLLLSNDKIQINFQNKYHLKK